MSNTETLANGLNTSADTRLADALAWVDTMRADGFVCVCRGDPEADPTNLDHWSWRRDLNCGPDRSEEHKQVLRNAFAAA